MPVYSPVLCLVPGSLMVADLLNSDSYDTLAGAIGIGGIYRRKDTGEQCDDCRDNDGQQQERGSGSVKKQTGTAAKRPWTAITATANRPVAATAAV